MKTLTLSITNLDQVQHTGTARHQFDCAGGTIGSAGTSWQINDREQTVAPIHCEIRWIEGSFCVIDRCQRTYLNEGLHSLGPWSTRRLLNGDRLRIGTYRLLAQFTEADTRSLADLLIPDQRTLDQLVLTAAAEAWQPKPAADSTDSEICSMFESGMGNDPLAALDAATGADQENPLERLIAGERS